MLFYPQEKVALFVEGKSLHAIAQALSFDVDYKNMRADFAGKARLIRAAFYTTVPDEEEFTPLRPLLDFLEFNGWEVNTRMVRKHSDTERRSTPNMNVDIAVDAMLIADHVDHIVLCSGDSSFVRLVDGLQLKGKRVTVLSSISCTPPACSDSLRRQADTFVEIAGYKPIVRAARPQSDVPSSKND